jgi:hypothetical protein
VFTVSVLETTTAGKQTATCGSRPEHQRVKTINTDCVKTVLLLQIKGTKEPQFMTTRLYTLYLARRVKQKQSRYTPWRRLGERKNSSYSFTTSALDGGEWSASRPVHALPPGKGPPVPIVQEVRWAPEPVWTQSIGKILCPYRGSKLDRPVVQSVARHYTDWANPAPSQMSTAHINTPSLLNIHFNIILPPTLIYPSDLFPSGIAQSAYCLATN